jgi:hypothetical protein
MHRYLPHLHLVSAETATEDIQLNGPDVITFTFPQTEFFAVTAYQNVRMSQFKADFNPFASGPNSQALKLKMSPSNESKDETRSPNELKPVKGLNGLKSLMAAKRRSKDTSTVDKGLLSPDAQNVSLADGDKTEVKTDGPSSRLKSRPSNEMNKDSAQSPNELKYVKSLNNLKSLMGKRTSKDTSAGGQGLLAPNAQNVMLADSDKSGVQTSPSNKSKKDTNSSTNDLKPGKSLNNLKSLMEKHSSKGTSAVDQRVLSEDAQRVTPVDRDKSGVNANGPSLSTPKLKSRSCNELKKAGTTSAKEFNSLRINLSLSKCNPKDTSAVGQGLLSSDAQNVILADSEKSGVKMDKPSSCKKSSPSNETMKVETISPKVCNYVKYSRKHNSQKTSAADHGQKSVRNTESTEYHSW